MPVSSDTNEQLLNRARAILRATPLIDGHNDTPWQFRKRTSDRGEQIDFGNDTRSLVPPMHTDLPRLRRGGLGGQFWSVFVPADMPDGEVVRATVEQFDTVACLVERFSRDMELALSAADVRRIHANGCLAALIGIEGGHSIQGSLGVLRQFYRLGARYMTLTHWKNTPWADAATDVPQHGGLTRFGREVIAEMNRLGMLVDLSHVAPSTMHQALDASRAPVIFSHSSAFAICQHVRNVPDDVLKRLAQNGGVVMVNFAPMFISEEVRRHDLELETLRALHDAAHPNSPEPDRAAQASPTASHATPRASLAQVADHIDHIKRVAGVKHIGIGADFDGIESTPLGLEDVSCYPRLIAELLHRGYTDEEVAGIAGENILRVLGEAERVARATAEAGSPVHG